METTLAVQASTTTKQFIAESNLVTTTRVSVTLVGRDSVDVHVTAFGLLSAIPLWIDLKGLLERSFHGHDVTQTTRSLAGPGGGTTIIVYSLRPGSVFGCRMRNPRARAAIRALAWGAMAVKLYPWVDQAYVPRALQVLGGSLIQTLARWIA